MSRGKAVRQPEFKKIKLLQEAGLSINMASKAMNRSYGTINHVYKSKNFEAFKPTPVVMKKSPVYVPAKTKSISKQLFEINRKLDRMIQINKSKKAWRL